MEIAGPWRLFQRAEILIAELRLSRELRAHTEQALRSVAEESEVQKSEVVHPHSHVSALCYY